MSSIEIIQFANRLEDASTNERMEAISKLNQFAKANAGIVGDHSIIKLLNILREQGSLEEYQDVLELLNRLISSKDISAARNNTTIILSDNRNVDLLLDLLEHEDYTVGLMTSQILTDLYAQQSERLEQEIQLCPDGLNKLLRRLPDNSREEVRDQAIVIVQQLTRNNDEMRKNFVFNEGFEIIFRIISSEGGPYGANVVTHDCIRICKHVLNGSDICQRLFYGMGTQWIRYLSEFFDPNILENLHQSVELSNDEYDNKNNETMNWYEQSNQVICSVLAMHTFIGSLKPFYDNHQYLLASMNSGEILNSIGHWIARKGPRQLVECSLDLLNNILSNNKQTANLFSQIIIKITQNSNNKNIIPTFGVRTREELIIPLSTLLVENYVFPEISWIVSTVVDDVVTESDTTTVDNLSISCIRVYEEYLKSDTTFSDLLIQFILAPPPPSTDDLSNPVDNLIPLGIHIFSIIIDGCNKLLLGNSSYNTSNNYSVDQVIKACNILTSIFLYGSNLGRELCTAITTSHIISNKLISSQFILPYLLSMAGRAARQSGGTGYSLLIALLRMLGVITNGCERVARQILEDPSNLFVVDLASTSSENTGIPKDVQLSACYFIGSCLKALHNSLPNNTDILSSKSFLQMIDSRIGLQRFITILKQPIVKANNLDYFYYSSNGFKLFYETDIENIRKLIFEYYTGSGKSKGDMVISNESFEEIIEMQKEKINELESLLADKLPNNNNFINQAIIENTSNLELENKIKLLENDISIKDNDLNLLQNTLSDLQLYLVDRDNEIKELQSKLAYHENNTSNHIPNDEIIKFKEEINELVNEKLQLVNNINQKDNKIKLLESEMKNPLLYDQINEKKINELENRNSQLKQQIWKLEDQVNHLVTSNEFNQLKDNILKISNLLTDITSNSLTINNDSSDIYNRISYQNNLLTNCYDNSVIVITKCSDVFSELTGIKVEDSKLNINTLVTYFDDIKTNYRNYKQTSEFKINDLDNQILTLSNDLSLLLSENKQLNINISNYQEAFNSLNEEVRNKEFELTISNNKIKELITNETKYNENLISLNEKFADKEKAFDKMNSDMNKLIDSIGTHNKEIEALQNIITSKDDIIDRLTTVNIDYQKQIDDLNDEITSKESELSTLRSNTDEFNNNIREYDDRIKTLSEIIQSLKNEIDSLTSVSECKDNDIDKLNIELNQLKISLIDNENLINSSRNEIQRSIREIEYLNASIDSYKQQLYVSDNNINIKNEEINRLNGQLLDLNNKVKEYQTQIDTLNLTISDNDGIITSLNSQLGLLLRESTDDANNHFADKLNDLNIQIVNKVNEIEELNNILHGRDNDIIRLNDTINELSTNNISLTQKIVNNNKEIEILNGQIVQLHNSISLFNTEINELNNDIVSREKTINDLNNQLKGYNDEIKIFNEMIISKDFRINELTNQVEEFINDMNISIELNYLDKINDLNNQIIELTNKNNDLIDQLVDLKSINENLEKQIYGLNNKSTDDNNIFMIDNLKQNIIELNNKNIDLINQAVDLNRRNDELEHQVNESNNKNKESFDEIVKFINQINLLTNENENLKIELSNNIKLLDEVNNTNNQLSADISNLSNDKHKLQLELDKWNNINIDQINNEKVNYIEKINNLSNQLHDITSQYNSQLHQIYELNQQLDQLKLNNDTSISNYNNLLIDYDCIKSNNEIFNSSIDKLTNSNKELLAAYNQLLDDSISYKNDIEIVIYNKEKQINDLNNRIANNEFSDQIVSYERSINEYKNKIEKLDIQLKSLHGLNDGLKKQLQSSKIDLNNKEELLNQYKDEIDNYNGIRLELVALETWLQERYDINVPITTRLDNPKDLATVIEEGILTVTEELEERLQQYNNESVEQENYINELMNKISDLETKKTYYSVTATVTTVTSTTTSANTTTNAFVTTPSKSLNIPQYVTTPDPIDLNANNQKFNNTSSSHKTTSSRWSETTKSLGNLSPRTKEMAKIQSEIVRERRKLNALQEEHTDLLGLLAQQELELTIFKETLEKSSGLSYVIQAEEEAQLGAIERYGSYVNFRRSGNHDFDNSVEMIR